ncbi:hypothetical protein [Kiloniella sp. b19]|uniref:hypothetical protein n=1 Tax=Kiloniella sp. GXU_MW_B19 TaxID=3141326 RepID=UPI0031D924EE
MKLFVVSDIFCKPELPSCLSTRLPLADQVSHHALNELAGRPELSGEALHRYLFQDRGMNKAVATLTEMMTKEKHCFGLGYSAGGTALWKTAAFQAVPLLGLFCVSSTRLRDETAIPVTAHVFFGSQDPGRPSLEWLRTVPVSYTLFENAAHSDYLEKDSEMVRKTGDVIHNAMKSFALQRDSTRDSR